jgi:hypothetical protein
MIIDPGIKIRSPEIKGRRIKYFLQLGRPSETITTNRNGTDSTCYRKSELAENRREFTTSDGGIGKGTE